MSKIKKILILAATFLSLLSVGPLASIANADSSTPPECKNISGSKLSDCKDCHPGDGSVPPSLCACHPEYFYGSALSSSELKSCKVCNTSIPNNYAKQTNDCLQNPDNPIIKNLNLIINVLSGLAVMVIIGVLIAAGIQHSIATSPQVASNARKRIINAMIALFMFFFIYAFVQWLTPGGI